VLGAGGAAIIDPDGTVVAGPLRDAEGTLIADCDLRRCLHAKRYFDAAGHYSRSDVLAPGAAAVPRASALGAVADGGE
jgi:nitrilase